MIMIEDEEQKKIPQSPRQLDYNKACCSLALWALA